MLNVGSEPFPCPPIPEGNANVKEKPEHHEEVSAQCEPDPLGSIAPVRQPSPVPPEHTACEDRVPPRPSTHTQGGTAPQPHRQLLPRCPTDMLPATAL